MADTKKDLRYPLANIGKNTDYFQIDILEYKRKSDLLTQNLDIAITPTKTIFLPMPSNIQDSNAVSWGEEKMNNITAFGLEAVDAAMQSSFFKDIPAEIADKGQKIYDALDKSGINLGEAQQLFRRQLTAEAVNVFGANVSIDQILARTNGKIFNPNLELLFNGVTLRDFRFSFKMTPRDEDESDVVKMIIKTFKKYMAAQRGGGGSDAAKDLYLKTPYAFQPKYMTGNGSHKFLHKFKTCALKGVSVNYTGENVYATYHDGTPISLVMDLNFQELLPIYGDEYPEDTEGVGF